ncbi:MAG: UDP-N-acetylmuramoyl-tripeptide--D-alanyl-D-alanine ligase, partial [Clostridia bacterium]|nr:UDP-N-acetylmuramoyl-tripeptide--D-alanyl-D-alanine ligase [Clostridia bacterium]
AKQGHLEVGAHAANCGVDMLLGIGPNAKYIVEGFNDPENSLWFPTNAEAIVWLKAHVQSGDAVLCKGSLSMHTNEIIKALSE